jgi:peptidyl-prolyl cis-trans isomerase C
MFPGLVERLIDMRLVAGEARANGLADDPDVRRELAQIENQIISQVFLTRRIDAMVTEDVVQARYDEHIAALTPEEEVSARHILLETEEDALAVIVSLQDGADFVELAAEKSIGPSADRGGDIGYFSRDRDNVVPEFADAAFALEPGQISETPVQSEFGWHVIKVDDRRSIASPTLEEMREELVTEISQQLIAELIDGLRDAATIERFNMDGSPMAEEENQPAAESEAQPEAEPAP